MNIQKNGFWQQNVDEKIYHGDKSKISSTQLRLALRSPAHLFASRSQEQKDTPAKLFGRLAHKAILENESFIKNMRVARDFGDQRSKKNREEKEAWLKDLPPSSIVVEQEQADQLMGMVESILAHPEAKRLLEKGIAEISGYFTDPESGVECKIRPDWLHESPIIADLKTTQDASPRAFERDAWNYLYPVQAAFYCHGASLISGKDIHDFFFIAIEKEAPYAVAVYHASEQFMDKGSDFMRRALSIVAECQSWEKRLVEKGKDASLAWPGYDRAIQELKLPSYAFFQE